MARYDIHRLARIGLVIDVQADLLLPSPTRVVIPLLQQGRLPPLGDMTPTLLFESRLLSLATNLLFSTPSNRLGRPIANLSHYRDEIIRALDALFTGF